MNNDILSLNKNAKEEVLKKCPKEVFLIKK